MGRGEHVSIHVLCTLCLAADELYETCHRGLDDLYDVVFELCEVFLDGDQILAVVILLEDLLVQSVVDTALGDIWIFVWVDFVIRCLGS